ncbi:MAG: hypothetical protein ACOWWO_12125 [Peptococcaceae bacterium]
MWLLKGDKITETKIKITSIYNLNAIENDKISKEDGIIVESLLDYPPYKKGVDYIRCVNPQTKDQFYEYIDRPLTQDEIIQEQNEKIDLLLQMQMSMGGVI